MMFFTIHQAWRVFLAALVLFVAGTMAGEAQNDNLATPGATARAAVQAPPPDNSTGNIPVAQPATDAALAAATNSSPVVVVTATNAPAPVPAVVPELVPAPRAAIPPAAVISTPGPEGLVGGVLALAAVAGFIAYYCGLTRAKNCGHTCTVLLAGAMFGVIGFWISGFAVQAGGLGDPHAALAAPFGSNAFGSLDHELGFMAGGHQWGFMGSAGFFLSTDADTGEATAGLFLVQAMLVALTVVIALGGALERLRLLALAISSFLVGALIYPLVANWIWGGGWLAELGRGFGLGHGVIDLGGAGVIHLTAGTLAFVFTAELGPRYGRFGRNNAPVAIPGHNVPFVILGTGAILLGLAAIGGAASFGGIGAGPAAGASAANILLGAAGGAAASFFYSLRLRSKADPALLCRGLIGGAVAASAGGAVIDPWAAFLTGVIAAALIQATVAMLERQRIDDPVGVVAVHGAGGAWGLLAVGIFSNGAAGAGINGVSSPVGGLFSHGGIQIAAQLIGIVVCFAVVFALGWICVVLIHKIVGIRVDVADETAGLDLPKLGVLGYQADADVEKER